MVNRMVVVLMLCLLWCCGCEKAEEPTWLTDDNQVETPQVLPGDRDETFTSGDWTYVYAITNPGSRSQGSLGKLSYAGQPVPRPQDPTDFYDTPLGRFVYCPMTSDFPFGQADQIMMWDPQGWMRVEPSAGTPPIGKALPWPDKVQAENLPEKARQQMKQMIQDALAQGDIEDAFLEKDDAQEAKNPKDVWGTPYRIMPDFRGGEGRGRVVRLVITSAGPDKQFNTDDDLEENSNFMALPSNNVDILGELEGRPEAVTELQALPEE